MTTKSKDDKIRDFCKLQHACQKLSESMKIIYDLGVTHEELEELANSDDAVDQALAISPSMSIASYLKTLKDTVDLVEIYKYYEFDPNETPVDEFITMEHITPIPSSVNLQQEAPTQLEINTHEINNDHAPSGRNHEQERSKPAKDNKSKSVAREQPQQQFSKKKGKNLDPSLAANSNDHQGNNRSKNDRNDKNKGRGKDNQRKRLDPSLSNNNNNNSHGNRNGGGSNNKGSGNKPVPTDNEASAKLHSALGKYNLSPEYTIRQLSNGSFEATCKIKGLNLIVAKGYGRNKKAAQHGAASAAFTSQELVDLISSRK